MIRDNAVIFKGGKNGIIVILDEKAEYEHIKDVFRKKIIDAQKFFGDAKTTFTFKGKELKELQMLEMIGIVSSETEMNITFVQDLTGPIEIEKKKPKPKEEPKKKTESRVQKPEDETKIYKHSLRSGQSLQVNGSVIILGDVKSGSEVFAKGDIIVFGSVRGLVHAGCQGDDKAIVCAVDLQPIQLRIADEITYIPPEAVAKRQKNGPLYAFVNDGRIYIAPTLD